VVELAPKCVTRPDPFRAHILSYSGCLVHNREDDPFILFRIFEVYNRKAKGKWGVDVVDIFHS
jgi:hypothetical protein